MNDAAALPIHDLSWLSPLGCKWLLRYATQYFHCSCLQKCAWLGKCWDSHLIWFLFSQIIMNLSLLGFAFIFIELSFRNCMLLVRSISFNRMSSLSFSLCIFYYNKVKAVLKRKGQRMHMWLLWFNPSRQISTTQLLAHSPQVGEGRESER